MASTPSQPPIPRKGMAPRPPRIIINNAQPYGASLRTPGMPYTAAAVQLPYTAATNATMPNSMGPPVWPPYATSYFTKGFEGFRDFAKSGLNSGEKTAYWLYSKVSKLSRRWFTHIFLFTVVILYGVGGAVLFQAIEGPTEKRQMENIRSQRNELLAKLRMLSLDKEMLRDPDGWEGRALAHIREYKHVLVDSFRDELPKRKWTFWNTMFYCGTIYTTIGYGHIIPTTVVGRAVTIVYAIIGIPMFLILLADFGKLFTRGIKFIWVFVRRMYYTGTFRQIRKHHNVQQMVHGMNIVYEIAMRRPTLANLGVLDPEKGDCDAEKVPGTPPSQLEPHDSTAETPTSPAPETYLIDDEFNLPISVAIVILLLYIFIGAAVYCLWEDWTYFESIYFVFISMSTIGFGDFVPQHPIFMMCSIAYLIFGLALTSMCINVVQVKLSDSFRQASVKIGATIGFEMSDEEAMSTQNQTPIEGLSIPPSPKFERPPTVSPSPDMLRRNFGTDSPPPLPRRSPVTPDEKIRGKETDKSKRKKNKK